MTGVVDAELLGRWRAAYTRPVVGWDFSDIVGLEQSGPPSPYAAWTARALEGATAALDMGTGGGEVLLGLAEAGLLPGDTTATEGWPPNVPVARAALGPVGVTVVEHDPETGPLPFADERFDCVLNRHEAYSSTEVARVLRPGGRFVTQQVDGRSLAAFTEALGHTPGYQHVRLDLAVADAEAAGLVVDEAAEQVGEVRLADVEALLGYLRMVPWEVPADFGVDLYADRLAALHRRASTGPLVLEQRRFALACHRTG